MKVVKWCWKSEMDLFWCISMRNNAKSYKKIDGKAQGEVSSAVLKTWKTRETKVWITQNQLLYHRIGPCKSSRPEDSEIVGLGVFKWELLAVRVESNYFFSTAKCGKKKKRPQFGVFGPANQINCRQPRCLQLIWLVSPKTQNCGRFFFTPPNFGDTFTFAAMIRLWAAITRLKKLPRRKTTTFSDVSLLMVLSWKNGEDKGI